MDLLEMIQSVAGGNAIGQIGSQFGLSEEQTQSALGALLPVLGGALQRNAQQSGGLEDLLGAFGAAQHSQYLDNPGALGSPEAIEAGNGILGQLLGSKDVSRALANQASAQTGIGPDVLKALLPVAASLLMGSLSKQSAASAPAEGGLLGMLAPMLDQNRDGSAVDDNLGMAARFLQR
jgi:hypothetical protein